jgi:hypothetical protein
VDSLTRENRGLQPYGLYGPIRGRLGVGILVGRLTVGTQVGFFIILQGHFALVGLDERAGALVLVGIVLGAVLGDSVTPRLDCFTVGVLVETVGDIVGFLLPFIAGESVGTKVGL